MGCEISKVDDDIANCGIQYSFIDHEKIYVYGMIHSQDSEWYGDSLYSFCDFRDDMILLFSVELR